MPDVRALGASLTAARDYVLALQALDGSWTDWALPPGSSSIWTTAYVGWQLHGLRAQRRAAAAQSLGRAARWLRERQFRDGGWGYNETVGSDADSTSLGMLLLDAVGGGAPANAVEHLLGYQQSNGGFATYPAAGAAGSWAAPHADVTPVALLALLPHLGVRDSRIRRGIAHVLQQQAADGVWQSFWWSSFAYATHASLALLRTVGSRGRHLVELADVDPDNAFETALLLSCELDVGGRGSAIERRIARLISTQQADGSWASVPMLRVTRRDCFEPWAEPDSGPLFADQHRLFTTATGLGALARLTERPESPSAG
jgi:squalene-hopene/tetraprenyl-beta-curcumene cyclase